MSHVIISSTIKCNKVRTLNVTDMNKQTTRGFLISGSSLLCLFFVCHEDSAKKKTYLLALQLD